MDPLVENLLKTSLDDEDPARSPHHSDISDEDSSKIDNSYDYESYSLLQHGGRQTGPKGVLADHEYHKQYTQQQKFASIAAYNERMLSKALTTTTYREDELNKALEEDLKDLENISSDEEEKEALIKYREQRLKEIKENENQKLNRKRYGTLREISSNQYVNAIDNEAPDVCVVIHLYDNSNPQCRLLNECLTHLARKFIHSKFLRILAHDLDFDPIGLPALLVYKNGNLIANLVKITDEIGETNFDSDTVEEILLRYNALNVTESIGE
ncbi:thioredoxin-like protein [Gigaspora margarita]|uniref:Thioredoxin-like protein n=1 Tax=Gigaspora margarita TaxID=4874 RepID=A0A8H3XI38_GIGMA|nr:thioredoxin-like protein [Gigaspora margarita]